MKGVDRFWLLTWTCYGQWLPGDPRGSVTRVEVQGRSHRLERDGFGEPYVEPNASLHESAQKSMKGDPVRLQPEQAQSLVEQFQETSTFRKWLLVAVAIMANHVHVILGVPEDPEPDTLLRDLKAWGSRRLNLSWTRPESGTWWTESGSKRKLADSVSVRNAIEYLRKQDHPLMIWINPVVDSWD